jgi:alkylated DNA nucleotide flippase Atl1
VGNVMRGCRDRGVPCHRVIGSGGALGGYGSSREMKRQLLRLEGIQSTAKRIHAFTAVRWHSSRTT